MDKLTVRDIDVKEKRVLVRTDYNVPIDEKTGKIMDDSRIAANMPTVNYLVNHQAKVIICSHLGRPSGKPDKKYTLEPVAKRLTEMLGKSVRFLNDCIGPEVEKAISVMKPGDVVLLENLRFHAEEEKGDPKFAEALSKLAEVYVDDAFGTAHRNHASMVGVTKYLTAVAGLLLEKELTTLGGLLKNPTHPFGVLLGGAKVSDKVAIMENLQDKVDFLLVGGGMAATFLKALGYEIGQSLFEPDRLDVAANLIKQTGGDGARLILPVDAVVTDVLSDAGVHQVVPIDKIPKDRKIVDIGPRTIDRFREKLERCRVVFWNGPMGVYEIHQFAEGTEFMARLLADINASTIIGGGSTAEMVINMGLAAKMTFVSTGGGASMSYLGGEKLPGVEALLNKPGI